MTTGRIDYSTFSPNITNCGSTPTGRRHSKVWTGGDNPAGDRTTPNDYSMQVVDTNNPEIQWGNPLNPWTGALSGCFGSAVQFVPLAFDDNDELKFQNKIFSKIHQSSFNAGFAIAESDKTLRMIGDAARSVASAIHYARQGNLAATANSLGINITNPKSVVTSFSKLWLGLQYGVKPLLSDVYSGAEAIANIQNRVPRHQVSHTQTKFDSSVYSPGNIEIQSFRKLSRKRVVTFESEPNSFAGLGLLNPAAIAWELVPYSFVADWFLPIGAYLEAMGNVPTAMISSVLETVHDESWCELTGHGSNFHLLISGYGSFFDRTFSMTRSVSTVMPRPPLPSFTGTSLKSLNHAISGISLVAQRLLLPDRVVRVNAIHTNTFGKMRKKNGNVHITFNLS